MHALSILKSVRRQKKILKSVGAACPALYLIGAEQEHVLDWNLVPKGRNDSVPAHVLGFSSSLFPRREGARSPLVPDPLLQPRAPALLLLCLNVAAPQRRHSLAVKYPVVPVALPSVFSAQAHGGSCHEFQNAPADRIWSLRLCPSCVAAIVHGLLLTSGAAAFTCMGLPDRRC